MNKLWWATLVKDSPRYADWQMILQADDVPLVAPAARERQLGPEKVQVYELDVRRLNPGQRDRLIDWIVARFGERRGIIAHSLDKEGFPIRAVDVSLAFSLRAFI